MPYSARSEKKEGACLLSRAYLLMHASGQDFQLLLGIILEYADGCRNAISSTSLHDACLICTAASRKALEMMQSVKTEG